MLSTIILISYVPFQLLLILKINLKWTFMDQLHAQTHKWINSCQKFSFVTWNIIKLAITDPFNDCG